eukprot:6176902-Pleurochrysis_carterae.AAC.2
MIVGVQQSGHEWECACTVIQDNRVVMEEQAGRAQGKRPIFVHDWLLRVNADERVQTPPPHRTSEKRREKRYLQEFNRVLLHTWGSLHEERAGLNIWRMICAESAEHA